MTPNRFEKLQQILRRRQLDLTVLMDNVHKAHNLSAIIRSCDAVGIHRVHGVSQLHQLKTNKDIASGAGKWVEVEQHDTLVGAIDHLKQQNMQVLAAHFSDQAIDFREIDYTKPTALLLGTELYGVSDDGIRHADQHIVIPMGGMIASLNVSVAAAVILFEAQRQRELAGCYDTQQLDAQSYHDTLFEWSHPKLAQLYRNKGMAYPELDETGQVIESPPTSKRV